MHSSTRRTIADILVFASGLVILMFVITAGDARVRRDVLAALSTDRAPGTIVDLGDHLSRISGTAVAVVSQWSHLHPYLVAFALVGGVIILAVRRL